jgi:hypothetical protein
LLKGVSSSPDVRRKVPLDLLSGRGWDLLKPALMLFGVVLQGGWGLEGDVKRDTGGVGVGWTHEENGI